MKFTVYMKKTYLYFLPLLMVMISLQGVAQKTTKKSKKEDTKKETKAKKTTDNPKSDNPAKNKDAVKNKDAMFTNKNKSWVIGVHGGYPMVLGDVPAQFGIGYGLNIQKALGYSFALRLHGTMGYATGLNWQGNDYTSLQNNAAVNGVNNIKSDYFHAQKILFTNYRMDFTKVSLDAVYYLNNINFNTENSRLLLYLGVGVGGFAFDTKVDQLDANGNMYDYSKFSDATYSNRKTTIKDLKSMLDGKYETEADRTPGTMLGNQKIVPVINGFIGLTYKLSERVSLSLEASYGFTGTDELDGQRWYGPSIPSTNNDAFTYTNLGINIRLGKVENASWFSNPLSLPFKTLMDNKKKLEKVDKIEKQVADMDKKLDTAMASLDSLMKDTDGDGVADHFDKEDSTPSGAVVDGSGRTIFYKDADGNLVYVDPNVAYGLNGKGGNDESYGNVDNEGVGSKGDNTGKNEGDNFDNNGTTGKTGKGKTGSSKKRKTSSNGKLLFDQKDMTGKTIIYTNPSNKTTVQNYAGTNSRLGFLPAVFFESNSADLKQTFYPQLYEIAKVLHQNPDAKMHVIGYTDYRASANYNKKLGMRRAKAVEKALTQYFGVNASQLVVESKGKVDPLTNAKSMGALAANRRVQFQVEGDDRGDLNLKSDYGDKGTVKSKSVKTTKSTPKPKAQKKVEMKSDNDNKSTGTEEKKVETKTTAPEKTKADTTKKEDVFSPGNDF
jgi:OmpA-OmpF porin, OOP family